MPVDLEKYNRLKKRAERAKQEADRAEGALEQLMRKLKTDFDCETVEDAEKTLKVLKADEKEAMEKYEKELAAFEAKWGEKI